MDEAMARWSRMVDFCNRVGWHSRRSYKCERGYMSGALGGRLLSNCEVIMVLVLPMLRLVHT